MANSVPPEQYRQYPWTPRLWTGMPCAVWARLLWRHGRGMALQRVPLALTTLCLGVVNSALAALQHARYGRAIDAQQITCHPIFITGHWRSGTTVLHEAFACDPALACPTTYDCMAAAHMLVSNSWIPPWLQYLVPTMRPLDHMPFGLTHPQEDEFALCVLGAPSPYLDLILHTHPPCYERYISVRELREDERAAWLTTWCTFLNALTLKYQRQLVLKSPLHTCRLETILQLFPQACIVHLVRDPRAAVPSTMRLWEGLQRLQGLQPAYCGSWENRVLDLHARMHQEFERTRPLLARVPHVTVRYEDLCREPLALMARIYDALALPRDHAWEARLQPWAANVAAHTPTRHELDGGLAARIERACGAFMRAYGYLCG